MPSLLEVVHRGDPCSTRLRRPLGLDDAGDVVPGGLAGRDIDAVEGVDRRGGDDEGRQLRLTVVSGGVVPDIVGNRVRPVGQPRARLGECQGGALCVAEVRSIAPRGDKVDALAVYTHSLEL